MSTVARASRETECRSSSVETRRPQLRHGRSAPRSRNGCLMCKQRRVRCDEVHPVCRNCEKLQLECEYQKKQPRTTSSLVGTTPQTAARHRKSQADLNVTQDSDELCSTFADDRQPIEQDIDVRRNVQHDLGYYPGLDRGVFVPLTDHDFNGPRAQPENGLFGHVVNHVEPLNVVTTALSRYDSAQVASREQGFHAWPMQLADGANTFNHNNNWIFDPPDGQNSLDTFTFLDIEANITAWNGDGTMILNHVDKADNTLQRLEPRQALPLQTNTNTFTTNRESDPDPVALTPDSIVSLEPGSDYMNSVRSKYLLSYFAKIKQPPASILIVGVKKWRRLQDYFVRLSRYRRSVGSALFAIIELLANDDHAVLRADSADCLDSLGPALTLRGAAQREIEAVMLLDWQNSSKIRDALLASIFLLAWFEVVRDQVFDQRLFPSDLADRITTSKGDWNTYSRQLLQWLNTLDAKASHLGGHALLSQSALQVVSAHHTQISAEDSGSEEDGVEGNSPTSISTVPCRRDARELQGSHTDKISDINTAPLFHAETHMSGRQRKLVLLNTILQPALDWHLNTQKFSRRISSHDRHHRTRFTVKDEYEVMVAGKQLELQLLHLWQQRPKIIRLSTAQLREMVSADIALRLEAIFSLYMASFWVLFVHLHRVVWWHLPHSETTARAIEETWNNLQRSYGEEVVGRQQTVVHPALLWPLFLFESECNEAHKRDWAIEQLEALGDASIVIDEDDSGHTLPPFKLSVGATRNAKRAAVLLKGLVKLQIERNVRVDEKELSIELFGCHFSII